MGFAGWKSCGHRILGSVLRIGDSGGLDGDKENEKVTRQITDKSVD